VPTDEDVAQALRLLNARRTETANLEAKSAAGGLPKSVRPTLSAFSNDQGGLLLLGVEERDGAFRPVKGFDAARTARLVEAAAAQEMTPPLRPEISVLDVGGSQVVAVGVPELPAAVKPCFVTASGERQGSYTRSLEGDRRLTDYEIYMLRANRGQPRDDQEPVPGAQESDLDAAAVGRLLDRVRQRQPRVFAGVDDAVALRRLGVLIPGDEERLVPTLAGLLALGTYPQQFLPQLHVSFVHLPGTSKGVTDERGARFLDNQTYHGPIPVMVEDTVAAVTRNMALRSTVSGVGRVDEFDYPVEAVREAVVNALLHRDYSPFSRGAQVQVEMYADRIVVTSPGGLFGPVTPETLGDVSSSRNSWLAGLLLDVPLPDRGRVVCENRGSGIPTMVQLLRSAGMSLPRFDITLSTFSVTMPKASLLDEPTVRWLGRLGHPDLSDPQRRALALMRSGRDVDNRTLRQLGLDSRAATTCLADLVERGLAAKSPGRRYATYTLAPEVAGDGAQGSLFENEAPGGADGRRRELLGLMEPGRDYHVLQLAEAVGLRRAIVTRHLNELIRQGAVEPTAPPRSPARRYRLVDRPARG
jgi:ATP-dependent DNA helicase RecG